MKVILLRDVAKVGHKYEIKDVNDGFARNALIGKGLALIYTPENYAKVKNQVDKYQAGEEHKQALIQGGLKKLSDTVINFKEKANE